MASTTPPHCSITAATKAHKTTAGQQYKSLHQAPKPPRHLVASSSSASSSPSSSSSSANNVSPFLSSSSSAAAARKSHLSPDFSGKKSTRFVSKLHFNRPSHRPYLSPRHSSFAEEALRLSLVDPHFLNLLSSFEPHFSGSDDYCFLLRELSNLGHLSKVRDCYDFAIARESKSVDKGKLASTMISVLGRFGHVDLARSVFDTAVSHGYGNTVYTYSALISAYGRSGFYKDALSVFHLMKSLGLKPNLVTYNAVIDASAKAGVNFLVVSRLYDEMLSLGVSPDRITFNSMLAVCKSGLWEEALRLVSEMSLRRIDQDVFTYNTLLDVICKGGKMDLAFHIISEMTSKNVLPNVVTYSTVVDGFAKAGRLDDALAMFEEMKYVGIKLDRVCHNALLSIYLKLGRFKDALNVCQDMESAGIRKDVVTYNALLGGFGKQGKYGEVKQVFEQMKAARVQPNVLTYSTLIDVYSKGGLYREAMQIFKEFKQAGLKADVVLYSGLIDALCKNGHVESAVLLLDEMTKEGILPNVVTYNTIIDALGRSAGVDYLVDSAVSTNGSSEGENSTVLSLNAMSNSFEEDKHSGVMRIFGHLAADRSCISGNMKESKQEIFCILGVFQKMHELGIKPNVVTFSAILNACSRCNSLEDASVLLEELRLFDDRVYGVAHGLLTGSRDTVWIQALSLFDEVKQLDIPTASAFYNALTDLLWHFGQKRGAQLVVLEGKNRSVWENVWSTSCLDLHLMSSGAARAMVHAWLLNIRSVVLEGRELPKLLSILTGWGKHSKVIGDGTLKRAIEGLLSGIGAPFHLAETNVGRFISHGTAVSTWLKKAGTLKVLQLEDDRSQAEEANLEQSPKLQLLPV